MKYDFTSIIDRRGKDAIAVDAPYAPGMFPEAVTREGLSRIPMWVADMNFPTVPTVPAALIERASHPAYGYFRPTDGYFGAILDWQRDRNGVTGLEAKHIGYENGVLGGVVSALNVLCSRGDGVLLHSPTYIGFTHVLEDNGYKAVLSPLVQDEAGVWRMDYDNMEELLKGGGIHTAILCSPHNPTGRVWERRELEKAMELFRKYQVYVISDEIWSDLIRPEARHVPTQSVSEDARERTVALYAPSKTFNLAGLIGSYHIIYNDWLRDRVEKQSALCHYNDMNVLSMHALMAAYSAAGREWVDELREVLAGNVDFAVAFIKERFRGVSLTKPEGTYMLFLDCTAWCEEHGKTIDELLVSGVEAGVLWQDGRPFHGPCHIRMNLALPRSLVEEAFRRLDALVFNA